MLWEASGRPALRVSPHGNPHTSSLRQSPASTLEPGTESTGCGVLIVWWNLSWDAQLVLKGSSETWALAAKGWVSVAGGEPEDEARQRLTRVLPGEHTGHCKHPFPRTQEMTLHRDTTRWSIPKSDWLYSLQPVMQNLCTVSRNKTGCWLWLRAWTVYCKIQT